MRKCIDCGLEAHTDDELLLFIKERRSLHGRSNLCKDCNNERRRQRLLADDRHYLRKTFGNMKSRCYNPKTTKYEHYGGRGITVCQKWLDDTEAFVDWALDNGWQRGLAIDRVDDDGPYHPENCRWATHVQQMRNTNRNVTDFEKDTRICNRCKEKKPLEEFYRSRTESGGREYVCKECEKQGEN